MKYPIFIVLVLAAMAAAGYAADQQEKRIVVTVNRTPANSGKLMYASYCSPCHGLDGKGNGPTAPRLKRQPADLTALSRNNRGRYPFEHVQAVLEFGAGRRAHGTEPMPVWGPILNGLDTAYPGQNMGMLRIVNLNRYVETMQAK